MCKTIWMAVLAANLAISTSAAPAARIWTDTTGKFKVTADLVAVDGDSVHLDLGDRKIVVPLAKLVGTVQVETGGKVHTIELKDVVAVRGRVKNRALADLGIGATLKDTSIKVNGRKQQGVAVQLDGAFDKLDSVELVAGDGGEIPELGTSRGSSGGAVFSYDFSAPKIPADANLVVTYTTGSVQVEVPFEFANVDVPAPPRR